MSKNRFWFSFLLLAFAGISLTGCRFPIELFFAPDTPPPSQIETPLPTSTVSRTSQPLTDLTPTNTAPPCAFAQAEQSLPDVTAKIQDKLNGMGLGSVEAMAVAFGENCVDTLNNKIISFSAMETDFFFTMLVADTGNKEALGNYALQLLSVAEQFPPGETPGPNLGYLTIVFQDNKKDARLRARLADAFRSRENGLTGEEYYVAIGGN